jgi:hypothetical protein
MKKIFKYLIIPSFLILVSFFYSLNFASAATNNDDNIKFTNKNGIEITNKDFKRLEDLCFTEEDIYNMNLEEYNLNKGLNGVEVSSSSKYYEVTENNDGTSTSVELDKKDYNVKVAKKKKEQEQKQKNLSVVPTLNPDSTSTSYKTMTTQVISMGSRLYRMKNSVTWSTMPSTRSYDVNGVAWNSSQFVGNKGTEYATQNWTEYSYDTGSTTSKSATYGPGNSYWSYAPAGYGTKMNLPNDNWSVTRIGDITGTEVRSLSSYAYCTVQELNYNTQSRIDAYGRYAHANTTVDVKFGFSISLSGVGISVSLVPSSSFDYQYNTQATMSI